MMSVIDMDNQLANIIAVVIGVILIGLTLLLMNLGILTGAAPAICLIGSVGLIPVFRAILKWFDFAD